MGDTLEAHEIQNKVLHILRKVMKLQIQPGTPYSLSEVADDPAFKAIYPNSFIVAFLGTVNEYLAFQKHVMKTGLWVAAHTPEVLEGSERQVHNCVVVQYLPPAEYKERKRKWFGRR